jgi:hypothetical protein
MRDHFVIDGSNLATEGRTEPSLAQLESAIEAFRNEHPGVTITVVVDASFEHRIDPSERQEFAKVEAAGKVVSPPAGAVGRGDGFLLQIANRVGGAVVSNDSFQEFHAEYEWLFEPGRLIGGKPVPGVGWIFSLRRPVRGIVSRKTVQKAKQDAKQQDGKAEKQVRRAIAEATADALDDDAPKKRRRRGGRGRGRGDAEPAPPPGTLNDPASFLRFVIDHRLGSEVTGRVDAFASHGAFVDVDGVRCYVPLSAMGDPPPTRARDVLHKDEPRTFVVQAVDAPRRGLELALPGFEKIAGAPSEETVEAEVRRNRPKTTKPKPAATPAKPAAPAKKTPAGRATKAGATPGAPKAGPAKQTPAKPAAAKKAAAAKRTAAKKTTTKAAAAKKTTAKKTTATKTATNATAAKTTAAKKTATKATAAKKTAAKKATAKKTTSEAGATKRAAAKKVPAKKAAKPAAKPRPGGKSA